VAEQGREAGARQPIRLGDRYEIYPDRPLLELRSSNAAGFVATDRERPAGNSFALVCDADLPPRHDMLTTVRGLRAEALLKPQDWGVVDWPPTGRRNFAIIFDRPPAGRVAQSMTEAIEPMSEDAIIHHLLPPIAAAMHELNGAGVTHRAIRPTNLFYRDASRRGVILGECVSAPPGAMQPVVCETIESGMAMATGRGVGAPGDDLYALGATLVFLLFGKYAVAALSDEELLAQKIARGSYAALLGGARPAGTLIEVLRGLLSDDPRERWTLPDLELWLEGRRQVTRQPMPVKRAARPFEFAGQPYYTARTVAHAFSRDPIAALRALKGPEFEVWMHRSLADEERSRLLKAALGEGHDVGLAGHDERLIARVCIALDPQGPVRYKGFAAAVDGFGNALVAAVRGRGSVQQIAEALAGRLPQFWFAAQPVLKPDQAPVLKAFERLRARIDDRRPGFGIERVVYEMNPKLHCLSPLIEADYVLEVGDVLAALERASQKRTNDEFQVDRHLAAFIASRYRLAGVDWYDALNSSDPGQRTLGVLYLLTRLQSLKGPAALPALAQRVARQLPLVVDRYHNRARRTRIMAELPKVVAKGNLAELLVLVDSADDRVRDIQGFQLAQREHAAIEREFDVLRIEAPKRPERASELGQRYAATAAGFLAWLIAFCTLAAMS
jgi:eukaryotic-like serine/threonine-protein kinase